LPDLIRPVEPADWPDITAIFNHYVASSPAAYGDRPVDGAFFTRKHAAAPDYPFLVVDVAGEVAGFAYLAPFHVVATMRHTAVLTYFLSPRHTGRGLGSRLLDRLMDDGRRLGITNFVAHISSRNEGSLRFHFERGFEECGRIKAVGVKAGQGFDMVWVQRLEN